MSNRLGHRENQSLQFYPGHRTCAVLDFCDRNYTPLSKRNPFNGMIDTLLHLRLNANATTTLYQLQINFTEGISIIFIIIKL